MVCINLRSIYLHSLYPKKEITRTDLKDTQNQELTFANLP